jgi:hypothetical protein
MDLALAAAELKRPIQKGTHQIANREIGAAGKQRMERNRRS